MITKLYFLLYIIITSQLIGFLDTIIPSANSQYSRDRLSDKSINNEIKKIIDLITTDNTNYASQQLEMLSFKEPLINIYDNDTSFQKQTLLAFAEVALISDDTQLSLSNLNLKDVDSKTIPSSFNRFVDINDLLRYIGNNVYLPYSVLVHINWPLFGILKVGPASLTVTNLHTKNMSDLNINSGLFANEYYNMTIIGRSGDKIKTCLHIYNSNQELCKSEFIDSIPRGMTFDTDAHAYSVYDSSGLKDVSRSIRSMNYTLESFQPSIDNSSRHYSKSDINNLIYEPPGLSFMTHDEDLISTNYLHNLIYKYYPQILSSSKIINSNDDPLLSPDTKKNRNIKVTFNVSKT